MFTVERIKQLIEREKLALFYNDRYWRKLAHSIMKEQHYECQLCKAAGRYSKARIVHHVNYLRKRPDLAYSRTYVDVDGHEKPQLIALCFDCHEKIHERGAYKNNFSKNSAKKFVNEEKW